MTTSKQRLGSLLLVALCCIFSATSAKAETVTYDFLSSIPSTWTSSQKPNGYETTNTARGTQFIENGTLTLKGAKNVTKVVVTCSTNNATGSSISVSVGGKSWGTETLGKESNVEKTFTGAAASGDIVISYERTSKSVWIRKVVITADEAGSGNEGDNKDDGAKLDPNYKYGEPTVLTVSGETCSNMPYSFIQNNIEVKTSTGAQTATYFGCNAGGNITFTATQPIKAIVIDGYVKQNFEGESSSGELYQVDASDEDVEEEPVVAILDIDAKSITINCNKQMRCYKVYVYFLENPDLGLEDDDEGDELTYEWEPAIPTTLNINFDELNYYDFSDWYGFPCTSLYLSTEEFEAALDIYLPATNKKTGIAPGVYKINDSEEDGTVQASPGGDDYDDYPSYITTGFEYDEEYDEYYYTKVYYLINGTLTVEETSTGAKYTIDATTYYGTKVHAVFEGKPYDGLGEEEEDAIEKVGENKTISTSKVVKNGRILINKNGKSFDAAGRRVK